MKQAIVNFCKSTDTGLFLLDMPTGFGKTYSVLDFMVDNYDAPEFKDKKIFFVTTLKKNLPDKELEHVLFIRGILDRVAALVFYLKKDRANARAVMQARREFEDISYSFAASRIENIMKSTDEMIPERTHFSILMKYYLLGKKHFSQLKLF